jgi:hypothetical protein
MKTHENNLIQMAINRSGITVCGLVNYGADRVLFWPLPC